MTAHLLTAGRAAWVSEANSQTTYHDRPTLALDGTGADEKRAFLWFPNPVGRRGDNVVSAILTVYPKADWAGTVELTAERVTQSWKQNAVKWGGSGSNPSVSANAVATETVIDAEAGVAIELDVTAMLQDVAEGQAWYGVRLSIDVNGPLRLHSPTSSSHSKRPTLLADIAVNPDAPDDLKPDGELYGDGDAAPIFRWAFASSDVNAYQAESRVQVTETEGDYTSLAYDSDYVTNDATYWDSSLDAVAAPALTNSQTYYWRVAVRDQNGQQSAWSDEASFIHAATGDVQITSPEYDNADVETDTPVIEWYTDALEQRQVRIRVWSTTGGNVKDVLVFERPWASATQEELDDGFSSGIDSYTIPSTVPSRRGVGDQIVASSGATYAVEVAVRDEYARKDADYVSDTRYFDFVPGASITQATGLAAVGTGGGVALTWQRASEPDDYLITRNGNVVATVDGSEVFVSGTSYAYTDYTAKPGVAYTYDVISKVGTETRAAAASAAITYTAVGVWLIDPEQEVAVPILGDSEIAQALAETSASFAPLNRRDSVRIVSRIGGYDGTVNGTLAEWLGVDASVYLGQLETILGSRSTAKLRLIFGDRNIPVNVGGLTVSQRPALSGDAALYDVGFNYWQIGGYSVEVN